MSSRYCLGDLTLDTGRRQVLRGTESLQLGPLTYKLLLALIEAAPNVASHDELITAVWDGRLVSPETINQRVKMLRDALSDDAHNPRYIELIRGQGYRLIPPVEAVPTGPAKRPWSKTFVRVGAGLFVIVAAAVIFWFVTEPPGRDQPGISIAVLPFVDMSAGRDQEYFADGISEEILNQLSKTTTLRIIARTSSFSFKGNNTDVAEIAEALGVTHVLEGSVRKAGNRVRVTARLVDASDGTRIWSDTFDQELGNVLALQRKLADSVSSALKANLQGQELQVSSNARRIDAEAYDLYLQGQQMLRIYDGASLSEAVRYFEQSIEIDPNFIPAYYSLGFAYVRQVVDVRIPMPENRDKLRGVVDRGLSLAPEDAGLIGLNGQLARWDRDFELAEQRFQRSLQKDLSNVSVRTIYAMFKLDQGSPGEALELSRHSLEIDPLNPNVYIHIWACHMDLGNAEEAIAAAARHRKVTPPTDPLSFYLTATVRLLLLGDIAGSIRDSRIAAQIKLQELQIAERPHVPALLYYFIGDLETGDMIVENVRKYFSDAHTMWPIADYAYGHLVRHEIDDARDLAVATLDKPKLWAGASNDKIILRLAVDALIDSGEARRAVDFLETLAPVYASYRARGYIDAQAFSPAPIPLRSASSSYPALYFPDYIRALRGAGDEVGASNMLGHLEAILELRRRRGLFIDERHTAELRALQGRMEAALGALEKAEQDRTIYQNWQLFVLHNEIFAAFRDHPRFVALIERIRIEMKRQREQLHNS